jgi:hypothetical protein
VRLAQIDPIGNPALLTDDLKMLGHLVGVLERLQERPSVKRAFEREQISGPGFIRPHRLRS